MTPKRLPKPYYQDEWSTIYCGNCRELLPHLGKFDLLLTDPPYGHGKRWSGGTWGAAAMYKEAMAWDSSCVEPGTISAAVESCEKAIVWGGNYYSLPPSRCWLVWEKTSRMPTLADCELAWTNMEKPAKSFSEDRNPDGKRVHPTQKPCDLMGWCICQAFPIQTILDPFMGSGTTLVAAKLRGIKAVGIEIEEKYCAMAVERLRQGVLIPV